MRVMVLRKRSGDLFDLGLDLSSSHPGKLDSHGQHRGNEQHDDHPSPRRHPGESHG
jgi:hypothetical protein